MTQSNGCGPLSWSVQSTVEMWDATASCDWPSERVQPQVRPLDGGCGRLRSGLPGERTWIALHDLVLEVSQAAMPLFCAIAAIGPPRLLRSVWAVGPAATAAPASTRKTAVATRNRTRGR